MKHVLIGQSTISKYLMQDDFGNIDLRKRAMAVAWLFISTFGMSQPGFIDITNSKQIEPFEAGPTLGSGINAIDYDMDGDLDLYVLSDENTPNRLYRNTGAGSFEIVDVGLSLMMRSRAAVWFDYDGDHYLDVFVGGDCSSCGDNQNFRLFRQLENRHFEEVTAQAGIDLKLTPTATFGGVTSGDVNNDGFQDLLVTQYRGKATLYINQGNGQFTDATVTSGIDDTQLYLQPVIFDFDKDGWADIYLTVDYKQNKFWLNNTNGTFKEIGVQARLDNDHNDMGVAIGDYDADDDMDIYISNIHDPIIEGHHNVLLQNEIGTGQFIFNEVSKDLGVEKGGWGWGVSFLDVDNDGFLDLAATNGWVTEDIYQSKMWRNNGEQFEDISDEVGFNDFLHATTLISYDYDRDGDLDLAQTLKVNEGQTVALRLLENQFDKSIETGNYIVVKPRMLGANHWSVGATVKVRVGEREQTYPITTGISFYGQEPAEAHFGIGEATRVDEVKVVWPGGAETMQSDVDVNQSIVITDHQTLHIPVNLKMESKSSTSITLNWKHMHSTESGFLIERSETETFENLSTFLVNTTVGEFHDIGLEPHKLYYYRVRAFEGESQSEPSNSVQVQTKSNVATPTDLSGHVISETSVQLSWVDHADNEEGYVIQRSLSPLFEGITRFTLPANTTSFENQSLEPKTVYYYRVQAFKSDGVSDFSEVITLSTVILKTDHDEDKFSVFPNPSNGTFRFTLDNRREGPVSITLLNLSGKIVHQFPTQYSKMDNTYQITTDQSPGVYYLLVKKNEKEFGATKIILK